jgi:hypothetical protein
VKAAQSLRASGAALGGVDVALAKDASGWRRGEVAIDGALVEEALNWLENLGAIELASEPAGEPWLRLEWSAAGGARVLELHRTSEGETPVYVARFPERASRYRVSPIVVDPLVAALQKLAAQ